MSTPIESLLNTEDGFQRIVTERERQINEEGWTSEHDDAHDDGSLAVAAVCYKRAASSDDHSMPGLWPWAPESWKPSDDPIRTLVKAGALMMAEADRLVRRRSIGWDDRLDDARDIGRRIDSDLLRQLRKALADALNASGSSRG